MVSIRRDLWAVSARRPENSDYFDAVVEQPHRRLCIRLGYSYTEDKVFELFKTEEHAQKFAEHIRQLGASDIRVSPPAKGGEWDLETGKWRLFD